MAPKVSPISHRRVDLAPDQAGLVEQVASGSLAARLGFQPGDRLLSINGRPLVDVLDFQFHAYEGKAAIDFVRGERVSRLTVNLTGDEHWGITFADATFDGVLICENSCPFCFIKQIPKGMRKSLYVMDDDYRYSMLYGNFVTLTNLTEEDWRRIERERLSPMHVSVHATEPELRAALVGNPKGARIMEDLARLDRAGIEFHAQLVLCPGVNDGEHLDRSIADLSTFEHLLSIAGVPVGLTQFGQERQSKQLRLSRTCMRKLPGAAIQVRRYLPEEAVAVVDQATVWQQRFRAERGETFFYLGDEFYLMTEQSVPDSDHYDGFPQIEDGIGITRHLLDNLDRVCARTDPAELEGARGIVACGTLIGPTMIDSVNRFNGATGSRLETVVVDNRYFGSEINVSGLLTGSDLITALGRPGVDVPVFISARMVSDRTRTLLDDLTLDDLQRELGTSVVPTLTFSEVVRDLSARRVKETAA